MVPIPHISVEEGRRVPALLDGIVGENILQANYFNVIAKVAPLDAEAKASLLAACISALTGPQSSKDDAVRIAAVRGIVALLPLSRGAIADLLNKFQSRDDYEVHFTLFCYLDWAQEMPAAPALTADVLMIAENYLMIVPCETARAVWMAGDMLGGHWNEQEAAPVLMRTSQGAKYSVGRMGGLVGLKELLDRLPTESDSHKDILRAVRKISTSDPSKYVKEDADFLLRYWRKPLKS